MAYDTLKKEHAAIIANKLTEIEEFYNNRLCDMQLECIKKYDGVKYQKLLLDVDSSLQLSDIRDIKFN